MTAWEPRDIPAKAPALAILGVFVLAAIGAAVTGGGLLLFAGHRPPDRAGLLQRQDQTPPAPRLQVQPRSDLAASRTLDATRLAHAPKPIGQAMREEAARGWSGASEAKP